MIFKNISDKTQFIEYKNKSIGILSNTEMDLLTKMSLKDIQKNDDILNLVETDKLLEVINDVIQTKEVTLHNLSPTQEVEDIIDDLKDEIDSLKDRVELLEEA